MFCTKCGKELKEGAAFCTSCGAPAKVVATEETVSPTAEPVLEPVAEEAVQAPVAEPVQQSVTDSETVVNDTPHNGRVGFIDAIKLVFVNYFNFTGRASRSEFWWGYLFFCIAGVAAYIPYIGSLIMLAIIIPNLSLSVRRLHDMGKSWPFLFMGLIPIAGMIILIINFCKPSEGDNKWGKGPVN